MEGRGGHGEGRRKPKKMMMMIMVVTDVVHGKKKE